MLESLHGTNFEYQKLTPEEQQQRGILGRLIGICADFINPTRNGRKYSEELWEKVFSNPIMKERIENGVCYGELGHPEDRTETDMEKIAVCLSEVPKKGSDGKLRAVFDILSTPNGKILKALCDYGSILGVSSRGSGDVETDYNGNESVDPDSYDCEGFDIVLIPAVKSARLKYVTESLNIKNKKSLNESLSCLLEDSTEEEKKVMQDTIDNLNLTDNANTDMNNTWIVGIGDFNQDSEPVAYIKTISPFEITEERNDAYVFTKNSERISSSLSQIINDESFMIKMKRLFNYEPVDNAFDFQDKYMKIVPINSDGDRNDLYADDDVIDEGVYATQKNVYEICYMDVEIPIKVYGQDRTVHIKKPVRADDGKIVSGTPSQCARWYSDNIGAEVPIENAEYQGHKLTYFCRKYRTPAGAQQKELVAQQPVSDVYELDINQWEKSSDSVFRDRYKKNVDKDDTSIPKYVNDPFRGIEDESLNINEVIDDMGIGRYGINGKWWYFTTHGVQPGSIPKGPKVLEVIDTPNGTFVALDRVLNTNELREYDLKEQIPPKDIQGESLNMDEATTNKLKAFTVSFVHDKRTYSGIIYAVNEKDAINKFHKYCPSCTIIDEVRKGILGFEDPVISNSFEYDMGWKDDDIEDESLNINESKNTAVGNNQAIVEELKKMVCENNKLETKVRELQEKLSVCYAKEAKNEEVTTQYNTTRVKLTENLNKVSTLTEQLTKTKKVNENLQNKLGSLMKNIEITNDEKQKLYEQLKKKESDCIALQEKYNSKINEIKSLNENLEVAKKDLQIKNTELTKKLNESKKLTEQYKHITNDAVSKYLDIQATRLGVSVDEIKKKLPKQYSLNDVDTICESLSAYKLNLSKLPFQTQSLNESIISAKCKSSKNETLAKTFENPDDELDDMFLELAGMM